MSPQQSKLKGINYPLAEGFEINQEGVWFLSSSKNDVQKTFICAPLYVLAYARNDRNENYSKLLEFLDPDGKLHEWLMPQELLAGDGGEVRRTLLSMGLKIGEDKRAKELLTRYLLSCDPIDRVRTIDRTGWHGQFYVLPDGPIGKQAGEKVLFLGPHIGQPIFHLLGSIEEWQSRIAAPCIGNSRLMFSLSAAFAGPLLGICHEENGGFHLRGASSTGKTTALDVAASLFGGKDYIQRWRATANGLEATAKMYNDLLLPLDEMGEINPKDAGEVAYMLGNGTGKARADKTGGARDKAKFRCLFLSTGEISLAQHMLEDGKKAKAGQETRIADIPADLGVYGVFESLHGYGDGAAFSDAIKAATRECHGAAGPKYICHLSEDFQVVRDAVDATIDSFVEEYVSTGSSGQVKRVGRRFGLVAAGGELAIHFGIIPWQKGSAIAAAGRCFQDWLAHRGDDQDLEEKKIIATIQLFFEMHGNSRFTGWHDDDAKTYNRAGFKKIEGGQTEYYVFEEVFKNELCQGTDWRQASKLLIKKGYLKPSSDGRSTRTESLPGMGSVRCYRFEKVPVGKEEIA
jgi:putative DNA primase/helicase